MRVALGAMNIRTSAIDMRKPAIVRRTSGWVCRALHRLVRSGLLADKRNDDTLRQIRVVQWRNRRRRWWHHRPWQPNDFAITGAACRYTRVDMRAGWCCPIACGIGRPLLNGGAELELVAPPVDVDGKRDAGRESYASIEANRNHSLQACHQHLRCRQAAIGRRPADLRVKRVPERRICSHVVLLEVTETDKVIDVVRSLIRNCVRAGRAGVTRSTRTGDCGDSHGGANHPASKWVNV